jgi:hypothetical protein
LAAFAGFDLAVLPFGLSDCSAFPAFFGLPPSAFAVPARCASAGRAVAAVCPPDPFAVVRAPLRDAGVPVLAEVALVPVGFPAVPVELPARAGTALVPVLAAVVLAAATLAAVPTVAAVRALDGVDVLAGADLTVTDLTGAGRAGAAARALAASLSDVTAVSRALVAVEIAVSALVSVFADEAAWVAAAFSLVEAEVTLVAADATVRGVTAAARPAVVPTALVGTAVLVRLAIPRAALVAPLAPPVLTAAGFTAAVGFTGPEAFAAPAVVVVRARELARTELATRTGAALAAVVFVGGTDLPPIWIS